MNFLKSLRPGRVQLLGLLLAALVYGADRWMKSYVLWTLMLPQRQVIEILPFFDLRFVRNFGVSLGLLTSSSTEMRWILIALTGTISLGVLIWLLREKAKGDVLGLGLVLGGALGNIFDRYYYGFVVDYADLHFGEFRPFLIFNIADAAITIGVLIILARSFLSREKRVNADVPEAAPES